MAGKLLIETQNPQTQTVESVEQMAAFLNKKIENGILDLGAVHLVLSSKDDVFYVTTEENCSCPARCYHPDRRCKHMMGFNKAEPRLRRMIKHQQDMASSKLELFGHQKFAPVDDHVKTIKEEMAEQGYETAFVADY